MATAQERRLKVRDKYRTIIGRNHYSQSRRDYCYKKHADGNYYSDCSSSVCYTYREAGEGFGIHNTTGIWDSAKLTDVPVTIEKGIIRNPEALRIGDMLLFAGSDSTRKPWGYVGHVEMVGEIDFRPASSDKSGPQVSGGTADVLALSPAEAGRSPTVMLYGHGSGYPKKHEMEAYCRSRYNQKTGTGVGHKGLIRVRRAIPDDMEIFRDEPCVAITGPSVFVRMGPGVTYGQLGIVHQGDRLRWFGYDLNGWHLIEYQGQTGWASGKYSQIEQV